MGILRFSHDIPSMQIIKQVVLFNGPSESWCTVFQQNFFKWFFSEELYIIKAIAGAVKLKLAGILDQTIFSFLENVTCYEN